MAKKLVIKDIRLDGRTQQREVSDAIVAEYMEVIRVSETILPPVDVMTDGKEYWLTDGFHRLFAYRKLGKNYIEAVVSTGTHREAIWASYAANITHGFRRQPGTSKEIIRKILTDKEWGKIPLSEIARHIGVSHQYVSKEKKTMTSGQKRMVQPMCTIEPDNKAKNEVLKRNKTITVTRKGKQYEQKSQESQHKEPEPVLDSLQKEVPEHLQEVFQREDEIKRHIKYLNQMVRDIKKAQEKNDLLWVNCKLDSLKSDVGNLRRNLRFALPYAVCVYCAADINNQDCLACDGHGFLNELQYGAAPKEMK